jgi:hypothetical protein
MKGKIMKAHRGLKIKIKDKMQSRKWWEHTIRLIFWCIALFIFIFFNAPSIMEGIREYKQTAGNTDKLSIKIFCAVRDNLEENGVATEELWDYINGRPVNMSTEEKKLPSK